MDEAPDGIIEMLQRLLHTGKIIHIYLQNGGNYGCQTDYRQTSE